MKNIIKKQHGLFLSLLVAASTFSGLIFSSSKVEKVSATVDINDYSACESAHNNGNASALLTALRNITAPGRSSSYDALYETYKKAYLRPDGKINDYYSPTTNYDPDKDRAGSYKKEGDCFNREHSIPQSWWGKGTAAGSQGADPYIVVPTDGYVNNKRSAHPFGIVNKATYTSNSGFCKLGSSNSYGYSGTVFEPNDKYKGDFARIYYYTIAKYSNSYGWTSNGGSTCYSGSASTNFGLTNYSVKLFSYWSNLDPVDEWERNANEEIAKIQGNKNPFIDHPEYANTLWGNVSDYTPYSHGSTPVAGISISKTSVSLSKDDTISISATSTDSSDITWSTSNSDVASISSTSSKSGASITITGVSKGNATITARATIGGVNYSKTCAVEVTDGGVQPHPQGETTTLSIDFTRNNHEDIDEQGNVWSASGNYSDNNSYLLLNDSTAYVSNSAPISVDTTQKVTITAKLRTYGGASNQAMHITAYNSDDKAISNTLVLAPTTSSLANYSGDLTFTSASDNLVTFKAAFASGGNKLGVGSMQFVYVSGGSTPTEKSLDYISVDVPPTKLEYDEGECFDPTDLVIELVYDDGSTDTVEYLGHESDFTFSPSLDTQLSVNDDEISITYGEKTTSQSIVVNETSPVEPISGNYSLTPNSPFINGVAYKLYLQNDSNKYYFTGSKVSTYYGGTATNINESVDVFFEENGDGQNIYFMDGSVKKYFQITISGTHNNFDFKADDPAATWTYLSEYEVMAYKIGTIQYSFGELKTKTFNTLDGYKISDGVSNYKTINFVTSSEEGATAFGEVLLTSMTCDSAGKTSPVFTDGVDWSLLEKAYNHLSDENKQSLHDSLANAKGTIVEQAMARYDYIVSKYEGTFANFIGRNISPIQSNFVIDNQQSFSLVVILIVSSSFVIIFVGLWFLQKKKRR